MQRKSQDQAQHGAPIRGPCEARPVRSLRFSTSSGTRGVTFGRNSVFTAREANITRAHLRTATSLSKAPADPAQPPSPRPTPSRPNRVLSAGPRSASGRRGPHRSPGARGAADTHARRTRTLAGPSHARRARSPLAGGGGGAAGPKTNHQRAAASGRAASWPPPGARRGSPSHLGYLAAPALPAGPASRGRRALYWAGRKVEARRSGGGRRGDAAPESGGGKAAAGATASGTGLRGRAQLKAPDPLQGWHAQQPAPFPYRADACPGPGTSGEETLLVSGTRRTDACVPSLQRGIPRPSCLGTRS